MVNHEVMALLHSRSRHQFACTSIERERRCFSFYCSRQSDALRAIQSMDGQVINGRSMQVSEKNTACIYPDAMFVGLSSTCETKIIIEVVFVDSIT